MGFEPKHLQEQGFKYNLIEEAMKAKAEERFDTYHFLFMINQK